MRDKLKLIFNWITRNATWIALILLGWYFIQPTRELIGKFLIIAILEGLAIGMSGLALFAYTKIDFTNKIYNDGEEQVDDYERLGASIVTGLIFLGVHVLVAGTFFILQLEVL